MTPKRLTDLIVKGDREKLCQELAVLYEEQRAALAETAAVLHGRIDQYWGPGGAENIEDANDAELAATLKMLSAQKFKDWRVPRWTAVLALLGVCDKRALKSASSWLRSDIQEMPHRVLQVLDARRPSWLASWIAEQARDQFADGSSWPVERGLIRFGALPANTSDDYMRRMPYGLLQFVGARSNDAVKTDNIRNSPRSLEDALRADSELLEHEVWRLFEAETPVFDHTWSEWIPVLIKLSKEGNLDRERLLQCSVRGLALPFRPAALAGFGRFHEALKPTVEDREALVVDYLTLLGCQSPVVVGHALDALEELAKAERLEAAEFLTSCAPVFQLAKKGQPIKAVKIAKLLLKQHPKCAAMAAAAVAHGLSNTTADVQAAALDLLEKMPGGLLADTCQEIRSRLDDVAAALRSRVEALLQAAEPAPTVAKVLTKTKKAAVETGDKVVPAPLQRRKQALDKDICERAGVVAALQCILQESDPIPTVLDPRHVPRRDPADAVKPIASLDELIDAVTAAIEKLDDAIEIERLLDGISRFHKNLPEDFDKRVAPLRKRVEAISEPYSGSVLDRLADVGVAQVIRRWLSLPPVHREWGDWHDLTGVYFRNRTREIIWRMEERKPAVPLLALPTHRSGWLDPVAFVDRLKAQDKAKVYVLDGMDLAQALLRLTLDGRTEALRLATRISLYDMDLIRFALGEGKKLPARRGLHGQELCLAAAHTRLLADDAAELDLGVPVPSVDFREDGSVALAGPVCVDPALPSNLLSRIYSANDAFPDEEAWGRAGRDSLIVDWQNLVWPSNRRAICLLGTLSRASSPTFLNNLFDREMTWHDEAARLAAWALGSDVAVVKGRITDALIEGIGETRLNPIVLGRHLAAIAGQLSLNRVAAVFTVVGKVSALHHWSVYKTLDTFVGQLKAAPADLHHVLTLFLETATLSGQKPGPEASAMLKSITGASKTAKLAKQLLSIEQQRQKMASVREAALNACLERGERWTALRAK